jgi:hypothetical protein
MIHPDILARLPEGAPREKLLLLDGLAADALDAADSAQGRLNNLGRMHPGSGDANPNVVRLAAIVEVQSDRHQALSVLVANCQRWVRSVPPQVEIEIAAAPPPPSLLAEGEESLTPEECVTRIRAKLGGLVPERLDVQRAPEPKPVLKARLRQQIAKLAAHAKPVLQLERGAADVAVFRDPVPDVMLHEEAYVVGLMAWLAFERMDRALSSLVDDLPDGEAMTDEEQTKALAELEAEIDALERTEESLIEAAFERGVDILRRSSVSPESVLGVRLIKPVAAPRPARRRERLPGPLAAAMPQAVEASPSGDRVKAAE